MVYAYLIPSKTTITIRTVLSDEHKRISDSKDLKRTSLAKELESTFGAYGKYGKSKPKEVQKLAWRPCDYDTGPRRTKVTTYALRKKEAKSLDCFISLSASSRLVRREVMPFLYARNTFHFKDWKSLRPFLSDRPLEALQLMKSFKISIYWDGGDQQHRPHRYHQVPAFNAGGRGLKKAQITEALQLERLYIDVETSIDGLYGPLSKFTGWFWKRYGHDFENLDRLGLQVRTIYNGIDGKENELWNYLAPKMLKKIEGKVHEGPELSDRRIFEG